MSRRRRGWRRRGATCSRSACRCPRSAPRTQRPAPRRRRRRRLGSCLRCRTTCGEPKLTANQPARGASHRPDCEVVQVTMHWVQACSRVQPSLVYAITRAKRWALCAEAQRMHSLAVTLWRRCSAGCRHWACRTRPRCPGAAPRLRGTLTARASSSTRVPAPWTCLMHTCEF